MDRRCSMCGGLGWVLDCNDLNKPGPRMVEFIPCFYPDCDVSGQPLGVLSFKGVQFGHVSPHPRDGWVMSLSDPEFEDGVVAAEVVDPDQTAAIQFAGERPWEPEDDGS